MSSKLIYLELDDVARSKALQEGALTYEELAEAQLVFHEFCENLAAEWPPERIKGQLLKEQRRRCEWAQQKIKDLELENCDARTKGVSYTQRKETTTKIEALKKLFAEARAKGIYYNKTALTVRDFVKPLDIEFIHLRGFETYLKHVTM